jgi:hypothetical protein
MAKIVVAKNGVVINIVNATAADPNVEYNWLVADATVVNVGDAFDPRDKQLDEIDAAVLQGLFRHENMLREIVRSIRTNASINTAATTNGLPTTANSPDLTVPQFKAALKALV